MQAIMIGLLALELSAMPSEQVLKQYEECSYVYTGGDYQDEVFKYRLLKPEPLEPGKKYPVVLFLHGAGERGDDNQLQLLYLPELMAGAEYRQKFPCFLIAPQCRTDQKWVEVDWSADTTEQPEEASDQLNVALGALDDVIENYPIDPARVYLTGLSMGGYGSWDAAARYPQRFAAVVPVCGGGDEQTASSLASVPIWAVHGDEDQAVPVARSRRMIEAIREAGGSPHFTELKGVDHDSWTPAYSDPNGVLAWMFEQVNDRRKESDQP